MQGNQRQALRIAYCAGLIDGEGSICVTKTKAQVYQGRKAPLHAPLIRVGMIQEEPMKYLQETFNAGNIFYEGVRKDRPTQRPIYRWVVTNRAKVIKILTELMPYIFVKKKQAILVREMCEGWVLCQNKMAGTLENELLRREHYYLKCKELNVVGAAATTKPDDNREVEAIV